MLKEKVQKEKEAITISLSNKCFIKKEGEKNKGQLKNGVVFFVKNNSFLHEFL